MQGTLGRRTLYLRKQLDARRHGYSIRWTPGPRDEGGRKPKFEPLQGSSKPATHSSPVTRPLFAEVLH